MLGLSKVNDNWVPLQVKVFSRWVSSQLKNSKDVEVKDIQKDLSNGVALVELATELTHKPPTRGWVGKPKLKVEMVQNCELALDMFEKDGVNFVGISGKDISDNNQKLILGLIWTLILHYSVDQSVGNIIEPIGKSNKQNSSDKKLNKQSKTNSKETLMSWANHRVENYPNVHNFEPFDLSLCALLDSYFPQKINYYSLNPEDTEHNCALATKVMKEAGIPIYIYPEDLSKNNNTVDYKTLLTQLSSVKVTLDNVKQQEKVSTIIEKEDSIDDSDDGNDNIIEKTIENQREIEDKAHEIDQLSNEIDDAQNEIQSLISARVKAENQLSDLAKSYSDLKNYYKKERDARIRAENELKLQIKVNEKINNEKELILISFSNLESERDCEKSTRIQAEEEAESLKRANKNQENEIKSLSSKLEQSKTDVQILSKRLTELSSQMQHTSMNTASYENKNLQLQLNMLTTDLIHLENDFEYEKKAKKEFKSEIQRLRYAYDMIQNEKEFEAEARQEAELEVEQLQKKLEEIQKRSKETIKSYSQVIKNTLSKLHNEKELRKELEVKNDILEGALSNTIGDLYEAGQETREDERKISQLELEVERLSNELENVEDYIEIQKEEKDNLCSNLISCVSKNALLKNDIENEKEKKIHYKSEVQRLRYALQIAQTENDFEIEMNQEAEYEVEQLKKENKKQQKEFREAQKRSNETIKTYSKVIQRQLVEQHNEKEALQEEALKNELLQSALLQTVNDLAEADEAGSQIPELESEVERLSRELDNLETLYETQHEEKNIAQQNVDLLIRERFNLQSQLKEAEYEVERLSYALETIQNYDDSNMSALEEAKLEISDTYTALAATKYQVKKLEAAYEQAVEKIKILTKALSESQKQVVAEFDARKIAEEDAAGLSKQVNELISIIEEQRSGEEEANEVLNEPEDNYNAIGQEENATFVGLPIEGDNFEFSGKLFALTMNIDNHPYALTLMNNTEHFINEGGMKLDLAIPNIRDDVRQQFTFGNDDWNTVIDSFAQKGMVWDVANADNWNPPDGTPFYLFPFHGRHNQHFVYKDGMIYAKQNGQVVTYVGGDIPFVMAEPSESLIEKQTFHIELL